MPETTGEERVGHGSRRPDPVNTMKGHIVQGLRFAGPSGCGVIQCLLFHTYRCSRRGFYLMVYFRNLEIHVTHRCNLSCESCSHYSNHGHTSLLALDEAAEWMDAWHNRLNPQAFSLLGGEPTLHPQLGEFVVLAREKWPGAHLRLVTNGFFLQRHLDLPHILRRDPNSHIEISVHHNSPQYLQKIKGNLDLLRLWQVKYGIRVQVIRSYDKWTRRYRGFGAGMEPYEDNQPDKSWDICSARDCFQLFEGKIWKCAPLAYLKLQDRKYGLSPKWAQYLAYKPLAPDCTVEELRSFFTRQAEGCCGMCASMPERFTPKLPFAV